MSKPIASLSLDLDNKWSYMKVHGDPGWEEFPSYLSVAVPRVLDCFRRHDLSATVFVVGQDAARAENHVAIAAISEAGHELANHSFHHEPWLHTCSDEQIEAELEAAEEQIERIAGRRPIGFRGPGYCNSPAMLRILARRGYLYDASTLPTFLGPLARAYYFAKSTLGRRERSRRKQLFGGWHDGLRPLKPYWANVGDTPIVEIPVTTMPLLRTPIHASYVIYLRQFSRPLALSYFRMAMMLCRWAGVGPSLLLHPLDFLGGDDERDLAFFPGMSLPSDAKIELVDEILDLMCRQYHVVSMEKHADSVRSSLRRP